MGAMLMNNVSTLIPLGSLQILTTKWHGTLMNNAYICCSQVVVARNDNQLAQSAAIKSVHQWYVCSPSLHFPCKATVGKSQYGVKQEKTEILITKHNNG